MAVIASIGLLRASKRRVLIADDDPHVLRALGRVLSPRVEVHLASGAKGALARLAVTRYDAVISDDKMPDGSGPRLLAVVRERYPNCRRILMSGGYVPAERDLDPVYEYFFRKPFDFPALITLLVAYP